MYVDLTVQPTQLQDVDNFAEFSVRADVEVTDADVRSEVEPWGEAVGEHVWLSVSSLLAGGRPDDTDWRAGFDKMIGYAESAGWTRNDRDAVRAHIVRGPAD